MSYLENSLKRTVKTRELPDEEGYLVEKVLKQSYQYEDILWMLVLPYNKNTKAVSYLQ